MGYDFDLFVIGAGSGGIAAAKRAADYGAKVGIAEFDRLGGTCVNRGCVPKKLMVYASRFSKLFQDAEGYGWSPVESAINWKQLTTAVYQEVDRLNGVYQQALDSFKVELVRGFAKLVDAHTIEVNDRKITADKVLIAVGGYPLKPPIPGIEHTITSDDIFYFKQQPKRIVILGGGYIGTEFSCILHGMGTEVIQVIRGEKILKGFDDDLRSEIQQSMCDRGIRILNNMKQIAIEKSESGLKVTIDRETEETIVADAVSLAAVGRKPKTHNLGLENTAVELHDGAIAVDQYSRTQEENIYAVGDCTNRLNLTPVALNEGRAFADTVFGGKPHAMSYENVPSAVFSTPEAATVGLTEAEARTKYGDEIKIYRSRFRSLYYTLATTDEKTMMKLVVHQKTDRILGVHMVGEHAAEIIQGVTIALKMGATKANFNATVGIHPTVAEEFVTMR